MGKIFPKCKKFKIFLVKRKKKVIGDWAKMVFFLKKIKKKPEKKGHPKMGKGKRGKKKRKNSLFKKRFFFFSHFF